MLHLQVGAVVVGHDRNINYHKIQYATLCIRENPGCHFIATNLDAVTHLTDAQVRYVTDQLLSALQWSALSLAIPTSHDPCSPSLEQEWAGNGAMVGAIKGATTSCRFFT